MEFAYESFKNFETLKQISIDASMTMDKILFMNLLLLVVIVCNSHGMPLLALDSEFSFSFFASSINLLLAVSSKNLELFFCE